MREEKMEILKERQFIMEQELRREKQLLMLQHELAKNQELLSKEREKLEDLRKEFI